jgi:hypothetical protein
MEPDYYITFLRPLSNTELENVSEAISVYQNPDIWLSLHKVESSSLFSHYLNNMYSYIKITQ